MSIEIDEALAQFVAGVTLGIARLDPDEELVVRRSRWLPVGDRRAARIEIGLRSGAYTVFHQEFVHGVTRARSALAMGAVRGARIRDQLSGMHRDRGLPIDHVVRSARMLCGACGKPVTADQMLDLDAIENRREVEVLLKCAQCGAPVAAGTSAEATP